MNLIINVNLEEFPKVRVNAYNDDTYSSEEVLDLSGMFNDKAGLYDFVERAITEATRKLLDDMRQTDAEVHNYYEEYVRSV